MMVRRTSRRVGQLMGRQKNRPDEKKFLNAKKRQKRRKKTEKINKKDGKTKKQEKKGKRREKNPKDGKL